jgi:hypothetical protein
MRYSFLLCKCIYFILFVQVSIAASDSKNSITKDSTWNRGIALLDSGHLSDGLRFADSISNHIEPGSDLMVNYARKIIKVFIFPSQLSDSVFLSSDRSTVNDTLNLSTFNYRMSNSRGNVKELPNFVFGEFYSSMFKNVRERDIYIIE